MKAKILVTLAFLVFAMSCKNASESDGSTEAVASDSNLKQTDNTFPDGNEDAMDESGMQLQITSEAIKKMVAEGQLTEAQAKDMIANMERLFGTGDTSGFDPKTYGDSLNDVLENMQRGLESGEDGFGTTDVVPTTPMPRLSEKDRGMANLRNVLEIDRMQYIEEVIRGWFGFSRPKRKQVARSLASESISEEKANAALLAFFEVTADELELLKLLPASETITSESQSRYTRDYQLPEAITTLIKNNKASENFKAVIERFEYNRGSQARQFIPKAKKARDEFYKLNPGWYGGNDESGDTYLDSHRNYIHLPLGDLSFADRVVSFETKINNGNYPEGAIGPPDLTKEPFRGAHPKICNLGTRGVLTLEFIDNAIADVNGPDLFIFEMGAIEPTNLEISKDGITWIEVGKIDGGTAMVDIGPFVKPKETFTYIRLTDLVTGSELPGADVDAVAAIGGALRLNLDSAVLFDTGKYQLKESASEALEKLLEDIQEIPAGTIVIEGHTDNVGDPASNKKLSENRAKEVSSYLKQNLSKQYKFVEKGFGESQPVAPNDSEENKQKNRRVEILVMPSK